MNRRQREAPKRIHWLQHVPFEGLGSIEHWAARRPDCSLACTRFHAAERLPPVDGYDLLVVMGGPMSVHDDAALPWLTAEKRLIEQSISAGRTVLGICLGAQLIAHVLGAKVYRNAHKEIGWFPVERTPQAARSPIGRLLPPHFDAFHWHGDTFDLPAGAVHLARSAACIDQAFVYADRVLGLQFHLETKPDSARSLIENCGDELVPDTCVQPAQDMLADPVRFQRANNLLVRMLDHLCKT